MRNVRRGILGAGVFLLRGLAFGQAASKGLSLEVSEQAGNYILTVPVSRLVMTIPRAGLVRIQKPTGGSTDSPRYFFLEDRAKPLIISGWFEADHGFTDIQKFWADEVAARRRSKLPEAQDLSFENVGAWNTVVYDMPTSTGGSSNVRAEWIDAGTWIDLHLSVTADLSQAERRTRLRDALQSIQVARKP